MSDPRDIITAAVRDAVITHWRCPISPQCTRGQIRTRDHTSAAALISALETYHDEQHRTPDLMAALRKSLDDARSQGGTS